MWEWHPIYIYYIDFSNPNLSSKSLSGSLHNHHTWLKHTSSYLIFVFFVFQFENDQYCSERYFYNKFILLYFFINLKCEPNILLLSIRNE